MKFIKLIFVAFGVMLVLGACSNNESAKDIEELDNTKVSDETQSEPDQDESKKDSSSGAGGSDSDSGGSGSPESDEQVSKEENQESASKKDQTENQKSTSDNSQETDDKSNEDQEKDQQKEQNNSVSSDAQSSSDSNSSQQQYKLSEINGTAVEVIKGIYAVSIPKEQFQNISKDAKLTFKAGGKTYQLKYEKEVDAFANLYIDDNNLETLKKGIVITG